MAVNLTRPVGTVIPDSTPVDKAFLRQLMTDLISGVNGIDPLLTPSYASRAAAVTAAPALPTSVTQILVREGSALVVRSRTASADDPLFPEGARWGVVQRQDMASEIAARVAMGRDAGIPRLTITGGTPDAIVAAPLAGAADLGLNATGSTVMIRPLATNTVSSPTLQIGDGFVRTLQLDGGETLAAGRLVPGVWHIINFSSNGAARIQGVMVKPSELPAIRAAAEAASAAASSLTADVSDLKARPVMLYAEQVAAVLPARPNAKIVHWYAWSDPTSLMQGNDLWLQLPEPTVPNMPAETSWRWANARTGSGGVLQILALPQNESPPVTSLRYRIDGGAWVTIPAQLGDVSITGLTSGQTVGMELQYVNFLGPGIPTEQRTILVSGEGFSDSFNRANQDLSNSASWVDVRIGGNNRRASIDSNSVRAPASNETFVAQVAEYFAPDQFVEAAILGAGTNTSSPRGASLYARMPVGVDSGYRLRLAGASWSLGRVINGVSTTLASGARTASFPVQARLVITGVGASVNIRALIGGVEVANVTDSSAERFLGGTVGLMVNAAGSDGISSVRIDDFQAGNV